MEDAMKFIVILLIALTVGYFAFQPTIDKMFGSVTNKYSSDVAQNQSLQ